MTEREKHHQYLMQCTQCGRQKTIPFPEEPYPQYGDRIPWECPRCKCITDYTPVLTKKIRAELRRIEEEEKLKESIQEECSFYGFGCRFFLQSVIIQTPVAKWQFDYHEKYKTLRHENHLYRGEGAMHYQFRNRRIKNHEVIDYIATHDGFGYKRRRRQNEEKA